MGRWTIALVTTLIGVTLIAMGAFWPHQIRGTVTHDGMLIQGATVRLRATDTTGMTDVNGRFVLPVRGYLLHRSVTAWQDGYYIGAADASGFGPTVSIQLRPLPAGDHADAIWLPSGPDPEIELACGNCHVDTYESWQMGAHAGAATNPLVLAFYNGTDVDGGNVNAGTVDGIVQSGSGFRAENPGEPGNCASCHAPATAVDYPQGIDLNQVDGIEKEGVFCHFCHAVRSAQQPYAETTSGVHALDLLRPAQGEHLFIGPYDDVFGRDTYNPLFEQSQSCASCHSGGWWNVPAYASYDEWQASPYASEGVGCQDCHMAPSGERTRSVSVCAPGEPHPLLGEIGCLIQSCLACHLGMGEATSDDPRTTIALHPARAPQDVSTHDTSLARTQELLGQAARVELAAVRGDDGVQVDVAVTNVGAGHHLPTGSPFRHLILVVEAVDQDGNLLSLRRGSVLPEWAGGKPSGFDKSAVLSPLPADGLFAGDLAGRPGKGYAKIIEDYDGNAPAPPWRNGVRIRLDNRIPARETDRSAYLFDLPAQHSAAKSSPQASDIRVRATLIYRRLFRPMAVEKGADTGDLVIAKIETTAERVDHPIGDNFPIVYNTTLFAPSLATTVNGSRLDSDSFPHAEACAECHAEQTSTWRESAHSRAATSPLYRARLKVAVQNTQVELAPGCAGCHSPIGLVSGQIRSRWTWTGQEDYPLDIAAQSGVACAVCHGIVATTAISNAGYVLDPSVVAQHAADPEAHSLPSADRTQSAMCATCHETVNPMGGLATMTTYSEWRDSPYNTGNPDTMMTCQDCHVAEGQHGESHLSATDDVAQLEILDPHVEQDELVIPVRVTNTGAGHHLPTGATEHHQLWLDVVVTDATGEIIFHSGDVDEYGDPMAGSVVYGTAWLDAQGQPTERHWEAASVERDYRIPAGGSLTDTIRVPVASKDRGGPLTVRAALKYRETSGYLTSLMSIYLEEDVPSTPTVEKSLTERTVRIPAFP